MLWLKAFHVFFVITWFAGIFYLPRLYVYHADTTDEVSLLRFTVMERRLFIMMSIGAVGTLLFGGAMLHFAPAYLGFGWLRVKLLLVLLLIAYHGLCYRFLRDFANGRNTRSARWYRVFNEAPALLAVAIVILAVVKPF